MTSQPLAGGSIRMVLAIVRDNRGASAVALVLLVLAGLAELLGMSTLLPLLETAQGEPGEGFSDGVLGRALSKAFGVFGLPETLEMLLVLLVAGMVLKSALLLLANRHVGYMVAQMATDARTRLVRALLASRWQYYIHQPLGAFANAVATESQRSSKAFLHAMRTVSLSIQVSVNVGIIVLLSPQSALAGLGVGSLVLLLLSGFVVKTRKAGLKQTERMKSLISRLTDCLQSVKVLKAMAREELAETVVARENSRLNNALRKEVFAREAVRTLQDPILMIFIAIGVYMALAVWGLALPMVIVIMVMLERVVTNMGKVQRSYLRMVATESAYWSLDRAIKDAEAQRETLTGKRPPTLEKEIRIEGLSFESDGNRILEKVDMKVAVNELTCIVGPSGAGKTTLADVITGLLPPNEGRVLVDDVPLDEIDPRAWRRRIGYVPQETLLMHDTLLNNVTLCEPDVAEKDVEWALRAAGAWEFVSELDEGLETSLGERGTRFSGGQRQRIAVARALLHRPKVLILDEATSALDAEGEAGICATLRSLRGQYTILAIAHTRALMESADVIYHIERGRIVKRTAGADLLTDGITGGDKIS